MNLTELKRKNSVGIYRCILDGTDSIIPIAEKTGLSRLAVCELANELVSRGILDLSKPRRNVKGRRIHYFQPSNKYFTTLIDIQSNYISAIGISTSGKVIERCDISTKYENRSLDYLLNEFIIKRLVNSENYKFCLATYLLGDEEELLNVDKSILRTTKENLIVSAFSDENKAMLFEFNGKLIVSLYSHIYEPKVDKNTIMKSIPFDQVCTYSGDLYFDVFDALEKNAMILLEKYI